MRVVEERVATLEGRVQEQAARMTDFRDRAIEVRHAIETLHADMGELRADVDRRFTELRDEMHRRFAETDHRFAWLVGIVITGFVTVIATIGGTFWAMLQVIGDRL
jgi:hypothetical protein